MYKDRKKEHEGFLDWLLELIIKEAADVLIVAGDIFDTISPPNYALKMYYSFLGHVSLKTSCTVIIIGGNHDSVSTLNAPKNVLEVLNVHVIGGISADISDEIIIINNSSGKPSGIICPVPFLRDRDIRKSLPGENYQEKSRALIDGIKNHYDLVKDAAVQKRKELGDPTIPIIATGHLFTAGGNFKDDEGIREIHVGSLGKFTASAFPDEFDYIALGHLHRPQKIEGNGHIRYSGAPIPLSFSEAGNKKQIVCVEFGQDSEKPEITTLAIPEFQKIRTVKGSLDQVVSKLKGMRQEDPDDSIWVEVSVIEEVWKPDIEITLNELADELALDILAIKNLESIKDRRLKKANPTDTLDHFTPEIVFQKRLEKETGIEEDLKEELTQAFNEIWHSVENGIEHSR